MLEFVCLYRLLNRERTVQSHSPTLLNFSIFKMLWCKSIYILYKWWARDRIQSRNIGVEIRNSLGTLKWVARVGCINHNINFSWAEVDIRFDTLTHSHSHFESIYSFANVWDISVTATPFRIHWPHRFCLNCSGALNFFHTLFLQVFFFLSPRSQSFSLLFFFFFFHFKS